MRWIALIVCIGCTAGPGAAPDGEDDTSGVDPTDEGSTDKPPVDDGGGDTDLPACGDVCWSWEVRAPVTRPQPGAAYVYTSDQCNAYGLDEGVCPDGFTCGPVQTTGFPGITYELPWCQGDTGPHTLVLDVPVDGVEPEPVVPFSLRFLLDGEVWPGGGEPGQAGQLFLQRPADGKVVRVDMPVTRGGVLPLELPEGTWTVRFTSGTVPVDLTRWPLVGGVGVLQVIAERERAIEVDLVAVPVPIMLEVDGAPVGEVPAGVDGILLSWWSPTSGSASLQRAAGAEVPASVLLEPDTWDFAVEVIGQSEGALWPPGRFVREAHHTVERDDPGVFDQSMRTAAVGGDVRIDGVKPGAGRAQVQWRGETGTVTLPMGAGGTAGRYEGRVWAGRTYDVAVDPIDAAWPNGARVVQRGAAPGEVDADLTSVAISGTVTLNGAQPQNGSRGYVIFRQAEGDTRFFISNFGAATFSGRVWSGRGDVLVEGNGERLPAFTVSASSQVQPTTGMAVNVQAERVDFALSINGGAPASTGEYRGAFLFNRVHPTTGLPYGPADPEYAPGGSVAASETGPLTASVWLPRGSYALAFYADADLGLPGGSVDLNVFEVRGPTTVTRAARTVTWNIELQSGGRTLPQGPGGARGEVYIGSRTVPLPPSGPARVTTTTWSGKLQSVSWMCDVVTCGLTSMPYTTLWYGLEAE